MRKQTDKVEMANLRTKHLKSSAGFSLIELMTVVAIVGIMATIAVPNLQQMTRVSMQNEAKNTLAQLFSVEKMFRADQGFYTMCLYQAGYYPTGNQRRYLTGTYGAGSTCVGNNPSCWSYDVTQLSVHCSSATPAPDANGVDRNDSSFYPSDYSTAYMAHLAGPTNWGVYDATSYTMVADGWVGGATPDIWTIDQDQNLVNVQSGL